MTKSLPRSRNENFVFTSRGTEGVLLATFLKTHLSEASFYRRAVGFFSSSIFDTAYEEFSDFICRGGRIELICSPQLSEDDLNVIHSTLYRKDIEKPRSLRRGLKLLETVIRERQFELKIATVKSRPDRAIYHEKIGLFDYPNGACIAFEGSANESAGGYYSNYERITWYDAGNHKCEQTIWMESDFELLWNNKTPGLEVLSLHDAFRRKVFVILRNPTETDGVASMTEYPEFDTPAECLRLPARLQLRPYQNSAIASWLKQKGRGVFAMATGSGKTITALAAVEKLYSVVGGPLVIIITAPYLNLVEQWVGECQLFGLDPVNCTGASKDWISHVDTAMFLVESGHRPILTLVTSNTTFSLPPFQRVLNRLQSRTVLIADEVHNLGARHLSRKLPERIKLRLGLSATPERWMDEEGTQAVKDYFGEVVFSYSMADALKGDPPTLSPYTYYPILVEFTEEEREEYLDITRKLSRMMGNADDHELSDATMWLLLKRARLIACAAGKIDALRKAIAPYRTTSYNLVYCGDGRSDVEGAYSERTDWGSEEAVDRQIDLVTRMLGHDLEMDVATYTARTSNSDRRRILQEFSEGNKQALVAIRCLDEGVDVPQVRRAFILASSTNPRQFIQRRGRVLRRAEGKERAEVFDFVVVPPTEEMDPGNPEFGIMQRLTEREMARVVEFARLAENGPQAMSKLTPILEQLRLLHLG